MVHRREVHDKPVLFGNHGALFGNAMTWWDHETGSVWSQPTGEAILGERTGETLELLPSTLTTWSDWRDAHPETLALNVKSSTSLFDLDDMAIVVDLGDDSAGFLVSELRSTPVINTSVNQVPVAIVLPPGSNEWRVFLRQIDDEEIELELDSDGMLSVVNGTERFDPNRGISEDDSTRILGRLPSFTSFPDDYWTFFPNGRLWNGTGYNER